MQKVTHRQKLRLGLSQRLHLKLGWDMTHQSGGETQHFWYMCQSDSMLSFLVSALQRKISLHLTTATHPVQQMDTSIIPRDNHTFSLKSQGEVDLLRARHMSRNCNDGNGWQEPHLMMVTRV